MKTSQGALISIFLIFNFFFGEISPIKKRGLSVGDLSTQ